MTDLISDADDQTPGAHFVTVLSYNFWRRRFGADPQIIGKKISVNNYPFTIIGVAAQGFNDVEVGVAPDLRVPMMMKSQMLDYIDATLVMARLKPGVSIEQAQAATDALYQNIIRTSGANSPSERFFNSQRIQIHSAKTGVSDLRGQFSQSLILLMCMVGVVLLIACLNVANLLLARAATRRREIAVRLAVGAGRFRLVRQLLTEGFLLAALGGALGSVFARWGTDALLRFLPQDAMLEVKLDFRMLGFTLGVTVLTGLLFGLAPALQATRFDLIPALKNDAVGVAGSRRRWELRRLLVVLQVAISLVLLVSGGLFARSLRNLKAVDHGYTTDQIVTMKLAPLHSGYKLDQQLNFYTQLSERVTALPGVKSLTFSASLPFNGISGEGEIEVPGYQSRPNEKPTAQIFPIAPQFLATFGIPLLTGRDFNAQDSVGAPKAIIVNDNGLFALLLAALGLYGVMAYAVAHRTREIGVRMALGAQARDMLKMVIGQGLRLTLAGVAIGLALALALARLVASLLYGVSPRDPITFVVVSLALAAVAWLACYVPARRATKVDPLVALRHD